jgi:TPP-dependent pyruvate/acetoin dehydrogenase alpha subunit
MRQRIAARASGGGKGTSQESMAPEAKKAVPSAAANGKNGHTLISDAKFRQLLGLAVGLHRMAEGGDAPAAGQEAALAGVVADLRGDDVLVAQRQPQIAALLHAGVPNALNGFGPETASSVSERIVEAVSGAVADRMRKNGRVTVVYLPGAEAAGVLEEAKQLAEQARLPVLFVEEASDWLRSARRPRSNGMAESVYMPAIPVDAGDVVAMYRVAHESIARARQGGGPTRILCVTEAKTVLGNDELRGADAAASLEHWLAARGLPAQEWRQQIAAELGRNDAKPPEASRGRIEGL